MMQYILLILFLISAFIIFWAMIGFPISIRFVGKFVNKKHKIATNYEPTVTVLIVAHNEEKVIYEKLCNVINLDYPEDKLEILVSSDNSTDMTNDIVRQFITEHKDKNIRLYEVKERKGKTNAQNEAAKTVNSDILVMTDANSMLEPNAVKELVSYFSSEEVAYVTGRLKYINENEDLTSKSESTYWEWDLKIREIESKLYSVTAGNGALYAIRTKYYHDFNPIQSHDSAMPRFYVLNGKKALYNKNAIAYEKAGTTVEDEFKRKVRMARNILSDLIPNIKLLNFFKYRWYSYCYFGHRYCRNNLWISHILLFLSNISLIFFHDIFIVPLMFQFIFYIIAIIQHFIKINNKLINMVYYYTITIVAQTIGAFNQLTGKSKPYWEKAESTR